MNTLTRSLRRCAAVAGSCSVVLLALPLTGCDPIRSAVDAIDRAVAQLDRVAGTFEETQELLEGVRDKLDEGDYKNQVQELIRDVGGVAQLTGFSLTDFVRTRVAEDLTNIKRGLLGEPQVRREPVLTAASPAAIDFDAPDRQTVRAVGWNLDVASRELERYGVEVVGAEGIVRRVSDAFVHYAGQYAVTVDLSPSGFSLAHHDSALRFVGYAGEFSIPIVDSDPPRDVELRGTASVGTEGSHALLRRSDADVHSDDWTRVTMRYDLRISKDRRALEAKFSWDTNEANGDRSMSGKTQIRNTKDWHAIWRLPRGYARILEIRSSTTGQNPGHFIAGQRHDWVPYPTVRDLRNIQVHFDGSSGNDLPAQGMRGELDFAVLAREAD